MRFRIWIDDRDERGILELGEGEGETFREACDDWARRHLRRKKARYYRSAEGTYAGMGLLTDEQAIALSRERMEAPWRSV